ncbi:unnamed protein product [Cuscuta europaea]|uniref:Uncharacterized protein n=1 Tax=Cuscuta europaea TaxID=41803 RepID=A0A9P1E055_CUSEU|nr:unnamed protein product [Cuscuta europaea]
MDTKKLQSLAFTKDKICLQLRVDWASKSMTTTGKPPRTESQKLSSEAVQTGKPPCTVQVLSLGWDLGFCRNGTLCTIAAASLLPCCLFPCACGVGFGMLRLRAVV